jgi:hypothetical protein
MRVLVTARQAGSAAALAPVISVIAQRDGFLLSIKPIPADDELRSALGGLELAEALAVASSALPSLR